MAETLPALHAALFRVARLEVTPESPIPNYRQAYGHFDRLVTEYADSSYASEARAWRETLGQLLAREQEAARVRQDMERLKRVEIRLEQGALRIKQDLERLKKLGMEQREAVRARGELERLNTTDAEQAVRRRDAEDAGR